MITPFEIDLKRGETIEIKITSDGENVEVSHNGKVTSRHRFRESDGFLGFGKSEYLEQYFFAQRDTMGGGMSHGFHSGATK